MGTILKECLTFCPRIMNHLLLALPEAAKLDDFVEAFPSNSESEGDVDENYNFSLWDSSF